VPRVQTDDRTIRMPPSLVGIAVLKLGRVSGAKAGTTDVDFTSRSRVLEKMIAFD
jgi:hypothetical protein